MTEKERGDFDAAILSINARRCGVDLSPEIEAWVSERLHGLAADAAIRVANRISRAGGPRATR